MSQELVEVQGTVQPDGTLVLDEKLNLAPGRVRVMVRPAAPPAEDPFLQRLQAIRDSLASAGSRPNPEHTLAARQAIRDEMEQEILDAMRLQEECRRRRKEDSG
jgi:hypothetical protein